MSQLRNAEIGSGDLETASLFVADAGELAILRDAPREAGVSLLRGGEPVRAITALYKSERPCDAAQSILDDLPLFPL